MLSLMLMLTLVRRWSIVEPLRLRLRLKLLHLLMIELRPWCCCCIGRRSLVVNHIQWVDKVLSLVEPLLCIRRILAVNHIYGEVKMLSLLLRLRMIHLKNWSKH